MTIVAGKAFGGRFWQFFAIKPFAVSRPQKDPLTQNFMVHFSGTKLLTLSNQKWSWWASKVGP
jgi:hypothetical protein